MKNVKILKVLELKLKNPQFDILDNNDVDKIADEY